MLGEEIMFRMWRDKEFVWMQALPYLAFCVHKDDLPDFTAMCEMMCEHPELTYMAFSSDGALDTETKGGN